MTNYGEVVAGWGVITAAIAVGMLLPISGTVAWILLFAGLGLGLVGASHAQ